MIDYIVECEECGETTYVAAYAKPKFCSVCGRRAEVETCRLDIEEPDFVEE